MRRRRQRRLCSINSIVTTTALGRLSAREFTAADTDKDGMLSKGEYLSIVEQQFKAADTDNDGTLTRRELRSKAGRQLLLLLK